MENRIFVVGVPRSGTTLVQSLLAAQSRVTSFTESHFFDRHFTLLPISSRPVLTRNPGARVREFLLENGEEAPAAAAWFMGRGRGTLNARPLLPFRTDQIARGFLRTLDEITLAREKSNWVEKTPRHLRYLPFLERISGPTPRIRFVHVIREGLEVVASLNAASQGWEHPYDLDTCVRRWNADVGYSLARVGAPNDLFLFYEELTSRPEATLVQLFAGLGLDWEPEILERYADASQSLVAGGEEAWKANIGRDIRRSGTSSRTLTEAERRRVTQALRRDLYDELLERTRPRAENAESAP